MRGERSDREDRGEERRDETRNASGSDISPTRLDGYCGSGFSPTRLDGYCGSGFSPTIFDPHGSTVHAAFGASPSISGAYIASTRVAGIAKVPGLSSRTVYSTTNVPFGT